MLMSKRQWTYLKFFWPLSLMGILLQVGRLAQNYVLLDFDRGVRELAMFALALGILGPFRSVVAMVPQMVTVVGDSPAARRRCLRFVTAVYLVITLPLLILAWTPLGALTARALYDVDAAGARTIVFYLRFLSPMLLVIGWRQYFSGLLIRQRRTGWITLLQAIGQVLVIAVLAIGTRFALDAVRVISLSAVVPAVISLVVAGVLVWRRPVRDSDPEETPEPKSYRQLLQYFWPLAVTTFMFTLSRPLIFALVTRLNPTRDPSGIDTTAMIAALSLAFSCGIMFQGTVNQFRHLMVTFGKKDPAGVRRFMTAVTIVVSGVMVLVLATPAARLFLYHLQGARGETLEMTLGALWVLALVPAVIAWRNYHHGLAMVQSRTVALAAGSLARNGSIIIVGLALLAAGWLNHWTGAALLVTCFFSEAAAVMITRWRLGIAAADRPGEVAG